GLVSTGQSVKWTAAPPIDKPARKARTPSHLSEPRLAAANHPGRATDHNAAAPSSPRYGWNTSPVPAASSNRWWVAVARQVRACHRLLIGIGPYLLSSRSCRA